MSDVIAPEVVEKVMQVKFPNMMLAGPDRIMPHPNTPQPLLLLLHGKCSNNAIPFTDANYFDEYKKMLPLIDGAHYGMMEDIARRFSRAQAMLQTEYENKKGMLRKQDIAEPFADYYHMLSPTCKANQYMRSLIEKAFEVLELGPIPPAKFSARLTTKKLEGPATNEGMSL